MRFKDELESDFRRLKKQEQKLQINLKEAASILKTLQQKISIGLETQNPLYIELTSLINNIIKLMIQDHIQILQQENQPITKEYIENLLDIFNYSIILAAFYFNKNFKDKQDKESRSIYLFDLFKLFWYNIEEIGNYMDVSGSNVNIDETMIFSIKELLNYELKNFK